MTVLQLVTAILTDMPNLNAHVRLTVTCPYGGASLPVEVTRCYQTADNSINLAIELTPKDGVEFKVCDVQEDDNV
jgi:hypothetical protein